jgi:hypothetical protein
VITIKGGRSFETDGAPPEQMRQAAMELDEIADAIELKLNLAEREVGTDPTWYARAVFAVKRKRKQANWLRHLAKIQEKQENKAMSEQENNQFAVVFLKTTHAVLKAQGLENLWHNIFDRAKFNYEMQKLEGQAQDG